MFPLRHAALINLGGNPLVELILTILIVGFVVWVAIWIVDNLLKEIIKEPFLKAARMLIIAAGIVCVVDVALKVIFGINLF